MVRRGLSVCLLVQNPLAFGQTQSLVIWRRIPHNCSLRAVLILDLAHHRLLLPSPSQHCCGESAGGSGNTDRCCMPVAAAALYLLQ